MAAAGGGELYLVLDQMEEYVLYHGRDGGPLADALEEVLLRPDVPVHVLLGVRDDSLADLDEKLAALDLEHPYPGEAAEGQRGRAGTPKIPSVPYGWLDSREIDADLAAAGTHTGHRLTGTTR